MKRKAHEESTRSLRVAAARIATILGTESCALIGGLAVAAHGFRRATQDVDFMTDLPLREAQRRLTEDGLSVDVRRGDPQEGLPTILRVEVDGVPVDILPMLVRCDWKRLRAVSLTPDVSVKVADLDTLLLLKARAGGIQDMLDIAHLVWRDTSRLPLARDLAKRHGVADKLEACLEDRRERQRFLDQLTPAKKRAAAAELARLLPIPTLGKDERPR